MSKKLQQPFSDLALRVYGTPDVARILGMTRDRVTHLVTKGHIRGAKIGNRFLVSHLALEEFVKEVQNA